jgi:hypothetical protein
MQQYKSEKNIELEAKLLRRSEKRRGDVPFAIGENQAGRIVVKFTKEYEEIPIVVTSTVVNEGSEFNVRTVLTSVTQSEFTVNILNSSLNPVKGVVQWVLM